MLPPAPADRPPHSEMLFVGPLGSRRAPPPPDASPLRRSAAFPEIPFPLRTQRSPARAGSHLSGFPPIPILSHSLPGARSASLGRSPRLRPPELPPTPGRKSSPPYRSL